jgi:hypothetical protein
MPRFEKTGTIPTVPDDYYNATISEFINITDRVKEYADIAIEILLNCEDVEFETKIAYFIKFSRLGNGELNPDENSWVRPFNNLLDTIRYNGGFDRFGIFRDESGEEIDKNAIDEELAKHFLNTFPDGGYPFIVYLEKDAKGYMRPLKRIYPVTQKQQLEKFVVFHNKNKKKTPAASTPGKPKL